MTIKQQGGIFGRNPTFNNVEVDGTLSVDGTFDINSAITITATSSTIESTTGAELFLSRDDTAIANNNLIGGLAFKANDSTASPNPQYCGMKAYAAGSGNNPDLEFYAGNGNYDARTPQLSINYLNNVTVETGNLVIGTSGKGIDFSVTSGTGTSELFDDYEEGSWQPVIGGVNTTSVAYYTKIGRVVYLNMDITSGGGASSASDITGLPYTPAIMHGGMQVVYDSVSASSGGLGGYIDTSSPRITIRGNGGTSAVNIAAGERIMAFGFYLTS